jgi:hypothetical protein
MTKGNRSDLSQRAVMVGLLELEMGLSELLVEAMTQCSSHASSLPWPKSKLVMLKEAGELVNL